MYRVEFRFQAGRIRTVESVRMIFNGRKTTLTSKYGFELEIFTGDIISIEQI